jgi:hypothetical protein
MIRMTRYKAKKPPTSRMSNRLSDSSILYGGATSSA